MTFTTIKCLFHLADNLCLSVNHNMFVISVFTEARLCFLNDLWKTGSNYKQYLLKSQSQ